MLNQSSAPLCQSCGMPMQTAADFGTNADNSRHDEYCAHCFQAGNFTAPAISMEQMIKGCIGIMAKFGVPEDEAKAQMETLIPTLKRWKTS